MAKAHVITGLKAHAETHDALPQIFSTRLAELWGWAEHLPHPERVSELHDMRIAAKRVRYCFEFFLPCFEPDFKDVLKRFKQLQDFLGEIHDCDVWVDYLRVQLGESFKELGARRKELGQFVGADHALQHAAAQLAQQLAHGPSHGLLTMMGDIAERRQKLYAELLEFWAQCEAQGFRHQLTQAVAAAAAPQEEAA